MKAMLLKVIQTGDPALRKPARKLTRRRLQSPEIQNLIDLMTATLRDKPGVGLAAPQVGESWRLIIIEDKKKYQARVPKKNSGAAAA